ncbi:MAG TPA: hypothetical protein VFH38_08810 [Jatrophihabitans sp.]|nr:hypothetical protein [Jatrophihabitans sp.]
MHEAVHMVLMGAITAVLAPAIVLATRSRFDWYWLSFPAAVVLPVFAVAHTALMLVMDPLEQRLVPNLLVHGALLVGSIAFWLPVFGRHHRLSDGERCVYLFIGCPALDIAGAFLVAQGNSVGGLAMIVGMLPIGFAALWLSWQWIRDDERAVQAREVAGL